MLEKWLKGICCGAMLLLLLGCGKSVLRDLREEGVLLSWRREQAATVAENGSVIPRMYLEGDIADMWEKTDVRKVAVEYLDGDKSLTAYATIKAQGSSSIIFEKHNYTIKFYQDQTCSKKKRADFGWGSENQYVLKANWTDRSHARNIVSARLAAQVQEKYGVLENAPNFGLIDGYPIELYGNGEFMGLYTLNIPKDAWAFGMDKDKKNHLVFCGEMWNDSGVFEALPDYESWRLEVGKESDANLEKLNRLFRFIMDSSDEEFRANFSDYLDLDAALNYVIMVNVGMMYDNIGKNMLLVTYDGQVWYPTLYDMDSAWGVDYLSQKIGNYTAAPITDSNRLLRRVRENFPRELAQRYFELRESILSQEHILGEFNAFRASIPEETFRKEEDRWSDIPGYGYDQIEEFVEIRLPALDEYMRSLLP